MSDTNFWAARESNRLLDDTGQSIIVHVSAYDLGELTDGRLHIRNPLFGDNSP